MAASLRHRISWACRTRGKLEPGFHPEGDSHRGFGISSRNSKRAWHDWEILESSAVVFGEVGVDPEVSSVVEELLWWAQFGLRFNRSSAARLDFSFRWNFYTQFCHAFSWLCLWRFVRLVFLLCFVEPLCWKSSQFVVCAEGRAFSILITVGKPQLGLHFRSLNLEVGLESGLGICSVTFVTPISKKDVRFWKCCLVRSCSRFFV